MSQSPFSGSSDQDLLNAFVAAVHADVEDHHSAVSMILSGKTPAEVAAAFPEENPATDQFFEDLFGAQDEV